ncbi:MAG: AtpZ/AtpI family protein [Thiohalomonadaceae bacterium]|jgi:ATP synthase protein I
MKKKQDTSADSMQRSVERMKKARATRGASPLRGFGTFGIIGWSVAVPTVAGALLGLWLERVAPQTFSWPLALMLAGMVVGIIIAWSWIEKEGRVDQS